MYAEIVTLAVMVGCLLCIIHSWLYRGRWETASFFVGGFIFGILRENIVSLMPQLYTYPDHPLYIGSAPLMMGFGWSASFYASWMVADRLLEAFAPRWQKNTWAVSLVTAVVTALLSIPVEVAAGAPQTGWWIWPPTAITVLWEMPALVPFGWGGAAFMFILFFRHSESLDYKPMRRAAAFWGLTVVVIFLHLAYVLGAGLLIQAVLA